MAIRPSNQGHTTKSRSTAVRPSTTARDSASAILSPYAAQNIANDFCFDVESVFAAKRFEQSAAAGEPSTRTQSGDVARAASLILFLVLDFVF